MSGVKILDDNTEEKVKKFEKMLKENMWEIQLNLLSTSRPCSGHKLYVIQNTDVQSWLSLKKCAGFKKFF